MENYINIFIRSVFLDNIVFAYFLGMCSYLAVSKSVKTATGLGIAVIFVQTITIPVNYLLENYLLKEGALKWLGAGYACLLYTSDAADEEDSVDIGGRRI